MPYQTQLLVLYSWKKRLGTLSSGTLHHSTSWKFRRNGRLIVHKTGIAKKNPAILCYWCWYRNIYMCCRIWRTQSFKITPNLMP
jgi:hypothetical protein